MRTKLNCAVLGAGLALVSCGSRTGLLERGAGYGGWPSGGGAGAFGGTGSGALGGQGGSGGSGGIVDCAALILTQPVAAFAQGELTSAHANPALCYSGESGEQVTVTVTSVDKNGKISLAHSTLSPWLSWPASGSLAPTFVSFSSSETVFATGQGIDGHWSLLFDSSPSPTFAPYIDAHSGETGPVLPMLGIGRQFVTRGVSGTHLVGTTGAETLHANVVTFHGPGSPLGVVSTDLGCASGAPVADAVTYQDGWLVVYSDWTSGATDCGGMDPESATLLKVSSVSATGGTKLITSIDVGGTIAEIHAAPHPSGVQLVYRLMSSTLGPIEFVRVDVSGPVIFGPKPVTAPKAIPHEGFAAAPLGTNMGMAWVEGAPGSPSTLLVTTLDDQGAQVAETSLDVSTIGPLAAIGAPGGQSLVVAWATPADARVHVARFDCADGGF